MLVRPGFLQRNLNIGCGEIVIEIVPYKNSWPAEFQHIATKLRQGLGTLALRIDHIGSTSVPGLASKDIIDIQVTVADLSQEVNHLLLVLGLIQVKNVHADHHPPQAPNADTGADAEWEKWLFEPPPMQRKSHIHVRRQGRANQRYPLLFRDYLRLHPATAQAYAELKRRLAVNLADPRTYPDVKDPAVDLIYLAAEEWAAGIHWQPDPSDG